MCILLCSRLFQLVISFLTKCYTQMKVTFLYLTQKLCIPQLLEMYFYYKIVLIAQVWEFRLDFSSYDHFPEMVVKNCTSHDFL
jgi:hypothetical protein